MLPNMELLARKAVVKLALVVTALVLCACVSPDRKTEPPPGVDSDIVPSKNITIALLGATGMVGGFVLQEALAQGYDIRVLARTPQKLDELKNQISIVQGDARDPSAIDALLEGSHIVISALGPVKADGEAAKTVNSTATGHIIQLMPEHDIKRYILVSGAAVTMPGDDRNLTGWLMEKMVSIGIHDTLKDRQTEYHLLANSTVEWTLVRCPLIQAEPYRRKPRASLDSPSSFQLRAGELARFMIEQIPSGEFIRRGPFLESQ